MAGVYESTRGGAPDTTFDDALIDGLAPDGGLYLPHDWPQLSASQWRGFQGASYTDIAKVVIGAFAGETLGDDALKRVVDDAYASFGHPAVAPLIQTGADDWVMELHHGPTLAFKDVAMQLLGHVFADRLAARNRSMTVVCATSGDTGGAAIAALADRPGVRICVLHPNGRISEVQRRFMTTPSADNILNIAVEGTFDDCQALVKALFADDAFRTAVQLGAVNSINWARIVAQTVYFVTACVSLGATAERRVSFSVPTGNFGDIFAGYVAKQMGAPIDRLIVATNENDILDRALKTGVYKPDGVIPTQSPSMDIQVSSNFERLLFCASGRDGAMVQRLMTDLASGGFTIPSAVLKTMKADFLSARVDEVAVSATMAAAYHGAGALIDPHTAVGLEAARSIRASGLTGPIVTLSTAHAAKFPDAVGAATGSVPILPPRCAGLFEQEERMVEVPNDFARVRDVIRDWAVGE